MDWLIRIIIVNAALATPTEDLVRDACREFDQKYGDVEEALTELFNQYPGNRDLRHILLKVVTLNSLYSTQILAVMDMASHILALGIDSALAVGSPEIVNEIALVTITATRKQRNNYSFATKYCNWHRPGLYPIWDFRVDTYLRSLLKQNSLPGFVRADLKDYPTFVEVMIAFRNRYHLSSFTFKEIDKFLWSYGEERRPARI
jgi:hypothetical protein